MKTVIFAAILTFAVLIASACGERLDSPQAADDPPVQDELPVIYLLASIRYADDPFEMTPITDTAMRQVILETIGASMQYPLSEEERADFIFQNMIRSLFLPPLNFVIEDVTYSFHGINPVLIVSREGEPSGYYHVADHWQGWWELTVDS